MIFRHSLMYLSGLRFLMTMGSKFVNFMLLKSVIITLRSLSEYTSYALGKPILSMFLSMSSKIYISSSKTRELLGFFSITILPIWLFFLSARSYILAIYFLPFRLLSSTALILYTTKVAYRFYFLANCSITLYLSCSNSYISSRYICPQKIMNASYYDNFKL